MNYFLFLFLAVPAMAKTEPVLIPEAMKTCTKSEECESVPLRCGCCQHDAVAKIYVTEYLKFADGKGCTDQPCRCLPLKLKPACVKSQCKLLGPAKAVVKKTPRKKRARLP